MVHSEVDILLLGKTMMEQHGGLAFVEAKKMKDRYEAIGNENGAALWDEVYKAIEYLIILEGTGIDMSFLEKGREED